jgi:hypothetical protein
LLFRLDLDFLATLESTLTVCAALTWGVLIKDGSVKYASLVIGDYTEILQLHQLTAHPLLAGIGY